MHKVILNMLVTKDLDKNIFDCIYPRGETLASIGWKIRASYHRTIKDIPGKSVFGGDIIFNFPSIVDWQVITTWK